MRNLILLIFYFLTPSFCFSKIDHKRNVYYYKEVVIYFNRQSSKIDTGYSYFKFIKNKDSLFVMDILFDKSKKVDSTPKFLGICSVKQNSFYYKAVNRNRSVKMYDIHDTTEPYFERNQYLFYRGKTFNSNKDTLINQIRCFKFIKNEIGGVGHDMPSYRSLEFINVSNWLPELIEIEQRFPWARIYIYHCENPG